MNDRLLQQAIDQLEDALTTLAALDGLPHQVKARRSLLEQQIRTAQLRVQLARKRNASTVDIGPKVTYARAGQTKVV